MDWELFATQVHAYWALSGSLVLVIVSTSYHIQVAQVVI